MKNGWLLLGLMLSGLLQTSAIGQTFSVQQLVPDAFTTINVGGRATPLSPRLPTPFGGGVAFTGSGYDEISDQTTFGVYSHDGTGVSTLFDRTNPLFTSNNTEGIRRITTTRVGGEDVLTVSAFTNTGSSQIYRYSASAGLSFVGSSNLGLVGAAVTDANGNVLYEGSPPFNNRVLNRYQNGTSTVVAGPGTPISNRPGATLSSTGFETLATNIDFADDASAVFRGSISTSLFGLYEYDGNVVTERIASDQTVAGLNASLLEFLGPDVLGDRVGFGSGYFGSDGQVRVGLFELSAQGDVTTLVDSAMTLPGPTTADDQALDLFSLSLGDNSFTFLTFDSVDSLQDGFYGQVSGQMSRIFGVGDVLDGDAVLIAANPVYVGDDRYVVPVRFADRFALYQVTAVAIPEPSSLAALGLVLVGWAYRKRRRR